MDTSASEYQQYVEIGRGVLRSLYGDDATAYGEVAFHVGKHVVNRFTKDADEARRDAFWRAIGSLRRKAGEAVEQAVEKCSYAEKIPANSPIPEHDALVVRLWSTAGALLASRLKEVQQFREEVLGSSGCLTEEEGRCVVNGCLIPVNDPDFTNLADLDEPARSVLGKYLRMSCLLHSMSVEDMHKRHWRLRDVICFAVERSTEEVNQFVNDLLFEKATDASATRPQASSIADLIEDTCLAVMQVTGWNTAVAKDWLLRGTVDGWFYEHFLRQDFLPRLPLDPVMLILPRGLSYTTVLNLYRMEAQLHPRFKPRFRVLYKRPAARTLRLAIEVLERRMRGEDWKQIAAHYGRRPSYIKRDVIRALHAVGVMLKPEQL